MTVAARVTKTSDFKEESPAPEKGYVRVLNPTLGAVTAVPESIVEALEASGFTVQK